MQGRIYALRYELCDDLPKEPDLTEKETGRTMWKTLSPIALFVSVPNVVTDRNDLVAVAIQMDHKKGTTLFSCLFRFIASIKYMHQTHIHVTKEMPSNNVGDNPYISERLIKKCEHIQNQFPLMSSSVSWYQVVSKQV